MRYFALRVVYFSMSCLNLSLKNIFSIFVFVCPPFSWLAVSMIMFSTFEHSVDFIYQKLVQKRKEDCSGVQQLGVTCLAGYTAGAVGTLISNPADNIVASLYNKKAENVLQVAPTRFFLFYYSLIWFDQISTALVSPSWIPGCEENWVL